MHTLQDLISAYNLFAEKYDMEQLSSSCSEDTLSDAIQNTDFETFGRFLLDLGFTQEEVDFNDDFLGLTHTAGCSDNIYLRICIEDFCESWNY